MSKLVIKNVVFCENVRGEIDGKYTLLGASAPELTMARSATGAEPRALMAALFVSGVPTAAGPFRVEVRVTDPKKHKIVGGELRGNFDSAAATSMVVGPVPIKIDGEGYYTFEWRFDEGRWERVERLKIIFASPASASA